MDDKIVLEVWNHDNLERPLTVDDIVARYVLPLPDAVKMAENELLDGYLVTMKSDSQYSNLKEFESR